MMKLKKHQLKKKKKIRIKSDRKKIEGE